MGNCKKHKKSIMKKKPTIIHIAFGVLVSIIESKTSRNSTKLPIRIGEYELISKIHKNNSFNDYAIGVYRANGEKYLIKTWTGAIKNYRYFDLISEYFLTSELNNILSGSHIYSPKVFKLIERKNSLSMVREFIEGKTLSEFSLRKQVEVLSKTIIEFNSLNNKFNSFSADIPKRDYKFYLICTLPLAVLTVISHPKAFRVVTKAYLDFIKNIMEIKDRTLHLAHRDLSLDNIIINKKGIHILDCGKIAFTYKNYDLSYISINPKLRKVSDLVSARVNQSTNVLLRNFILLNQARSLGNPANYNNFYIRRLYEEYK